MSIFNSIEILVVDDESNIRKLFSRELASPGRSIHTVGSAAEAFDFLHKNYCDIIILDIRLPDANGLELMSKLLETVPNVAIILITGYADVDNAVEAMKNGAYDYITKPFSLERMEQVIEKAYQRVRLQRENELLRHNSEHKSMPKFIGHSKSVQHVRYLIERAAPTDVPVLLTGESGTGKNVAAAALHAQSRRADQPLIIKNCGTFDKELLRSELFGYCKGAFTGADRSTDGLLSLPTRARSSSTRWGS